MKRKPPVDQKHLISVIGVQIVNGFGFQLWCLPVPDTYIEVDIYSSTLSSFFSRLLSSKPLRSTVSAKGWAAVAGHCWCPDPAPTLARMPTSLSLESSPSGTASGCLSPGTNHPFPPLCNECCSLYLQSMQIKNNSIAVIVASKEA